MGYTNPVQKYLDQMGSYKWEGQKMADFDITRWRSFAERYLVERASAFEPGKETEGIWTEVNNALAAYQHIYQVGEANAGKPMGRPADVPAFEPNVETVAVAMTSLPADRAWYQKLVGGFHDATTKKKA